MLSERRWQRVEQPVLSLLDHSHRDEVLVIVGQSFGYKIR